MIRALSKDLKIDQLHGDIQELRRDELIEGLKNWQLKSPQRDDSQEIAERLKNQRQELEKSHQQELQDVKKGYERQERSVRTRLSTEEARNRAIASVYNSSARARKKQAIQVNV